MKIHIGTERAFCIGMLIRMETLIHTRKERAEIVSVKNHYDYINI